MIKHHKDRFERIDERAALLQRLHSY